MADTREPRGKWPCPFCGWRVSNLPSGKLMSHKESWYGSALEPTDWCLGSNYYINRPRREQLAELLKGTP